jgi:hypothetical protein
MSTGGPRPRVVDEGPWDRFARVAHARIARYNRAGGDLVEESGVEEKSR